MIDPYPTRKGTPEALIPREEPVVHGNGAQGPLTTSELRRYARQGFLVMPSLIDDARIEQVRKDARARVEAVLLSGKGAAEGVIREPQTQAVRSIFDIGDGDDSLSALVDDPLIVGVAQQILGDEAYVHQSRVNFKPGFVGREFQWHSDFETWHDEDGMPHMRALSCSVFLSDNLPCNGPMMLIPGSHRIFVSTSQPTPPDNYTSSLRAQEIGVPSPDAIRRLVDLGGGIKTALGRRGTVVFFDCNTMHASGSNLTPFPRDNVFFVYNARSNAPQRPFNGLPRRPDFLAHRAH